jgi:iron complex outermembrane receptor protein
MMKAIGRAPGRASATGSAWLRHLKRHSALVRLLPAPGLAMLAMPVLAQTADQPSTAPVVFPPVLVQGTGVPVDQTTAGPVQGFRALTAKSSTRTATPIEQLPQNINVITRSLIDSQLSITLSDAVRNASNVQPVDTRMIGNVEQVPVKIRGFGAELWTDGFAGNLFVAGDRDGLVNVERVEVLKGPSAVVYGGGAGAPVGGVLNVVSKMPTETAKYQVGTTFGSYWYANPYVDMNQPLNAEKTALFRLTAEYTGSSSFIDVLNSRRFNINPTFTLTNKNDTTLTIQGFASEAYQQAYPGLPVDGTIVGTYSVNRNLYFGNPNIMPSYSKMYGVTGTLDHRIDNVWSVNVKARWSKSEMQQNSQAAFLDATGTGGTPFIPPSTFDVNNIEVYDQQQEISINPTVQAKFSTESTNNTLLIGGDFSRVRDWGFMNVDTNGNFCFLIGFGCNPSVANLQNPSFTTPYTFPIPGVGEGVSFFNFNNTYITKGFYGQLQSTVNDRYHFLVGARLASIDITYNEFATGAMVTRETSATRLLPRAGVVVDLAKGLSVYGSYSQGMKWVPFSQTFAQPEPEFSTQYEAGVKLNINDTLTGTVAIFQIERTNVPVRLTALSATLTQQTSRGFEADFLYQPNRNWSVLASYGYTRAFFADAAGPGIPAGNRLPFVPEHSGRFWLNYQFDESVAPGLSLGAGVYAASNQYVDAFNLWQTAGYYTVDAKIGYETDKIRAVLSAKNLTNNQYLLPYSWLGGQVAPGAPLSVYGQFAFKF